MSRDAFARAALAQWTDRQGVVLDDIRTTGLHAEDMYCVRHQFVLAPDSARRLLPRPPQGGPVPGCPDCAAEIDRPFTAAPEVYEHHGLVSDTPPVSVEHPRDDEAIVRAAAQRKAMGQPEPGSDEERNALARIDYMRSYDHAVIANNARASEGKRREKLERPAPWIKTTTSQSSVYTTPAESRRDGRRIWAQANRLFRRGS